MTNPCTKGRGKSATWLKAHTDYQGDDCLKWPFAIDRRVGRGTLGYMGKLWWAHRLMCVMVHGDPPTPAHQTAHSCGNGHNGCVNPRHLSWATNSQNQKDRSRHGRHMGGVGNRGRFTPEQIAQMRALRATKTQMEIAAMFSTTLGTIQYYLKYRKQRGHEPIVAT